MINTLLLSRYKAWYLTFIQIDDVLYINDLNFANWIPLRYKQRPWNKWNNKQLHLSYFVTFTSHLTQMVIFHYGLSHRRRLQFRHYTFFTAWQQYTNNSFLWNLYFTSCFVTFEFEVCIKSFYNVTVLWYLNYSPWT